MEQEKQRIIQEFVPGKQVTLAHVIANPDSSLYKKLGVIGDYTGALGIMTITPSEGAIIGADVAMKAANVEVVFVDRFNGSCKVSVWLCQIARNQYLSLCRERKHRGELEQEPGDDGLECGFADRDAAKRLHRLLHDLPEPYKEVFSLRTFGELPFAQIGELFGKTESWARVTYFRARQKLKEGFDGPAGP